MYCMKPIVGSRRAAAAKHRSGIAVTVQLAGGGRKGLPGGGSDRGDLMQGSLGRSNSCGILRAFVGMLEFNHSRRPKQ